MKALAGAPARGPEIVPRASVRPRKLPGWRAGDAEITPPQPLPAKPAAFRPRALAPSAAVPALTAAAAAARPPLRRGLWLAARFTAGDASDAGDDDENDSEEAADDEEEGDSDPTSSDSDSSEDVLGAPCTPRLGQDAESASRAAARRPCVGLTHTRSAPARRPCVGRATTRSNSRRTRRSWAARSTASVIPAAWRLPRSFARSARRTCAPRTSACPAPWRTR